MIPQNTPYVTQEMITQVESEVKQFQKEAEFFEGWFNQTRISLKDLVGKIRLATKNFKEILFYFKTQVLFDFIRWTI